MNLRKIKRVFVLGVAILVWSTSYCGKVRLLATEPNGDLELIALGCRKRSSCMPDNLKSVYHVVFVRNDEELLTKLSFGQSKSIALKAAWRVAELQCTSQPTHAPLVRFIGFLEGRTQTKCPPWWEACILGAQFDTNDRTKLQAGDWPSVDERLFPIHRVTLGDDLITVPPGVEVSYDGDRMLWKDGEQVVVVPRAVVDGDAVTAKDWARIQAKDDRIYLALGSDLDGSFQLFCLTLNGDEIWRTAGWGTGNLRGGASGLWWSASEIQISGDEIVVFGRAFKGAYIEAFDRRSGDPLYRFCTRYMEEIELDNSAEATGSLRP